MSTAPSSVDWLPDLSKDLFSAPTVCNAPVETGHTVLSIILIAGIVVSYLPQHLKILRNKSSSGLSPWYLMLGAVSSFANWTNIIILQLPSIKCCLEVGIGQCLYNLLGFLQVSAQVGMFYLVFLLFYVYFPPESTDEWTDALLVLKMVFMFAVFCVFGSVWIVGQYRREMWIIELWTGLLALVAVVASMIQFIPQIFRVWKLQAIGALSIPTMLMQTPGSFLFCYVIAKSPGTNFSSWINYFVGGCLQGCLLATCLYYYCRKPTEYIVVQDTKSSSLSNVSTASANSALSTASLPSTTLSIPGEER